MKFCENCGAQISDDAKTCPQCGFQVYKVLNTAEEATAVSSAFKFSLISLILSATFVGAPVSVVFAVLGIIKSINAKKLGAVGGRLKTSMIMAGAGLLLSTIIIVFFAIKCL